MGAAFARMGHKEDFDGRKPVVSKSAAMRY